MTHAEKRVQMDVKVVPRKCIADKKLKLYQYTAIDEYTRLRFLYGYEEQSTYSSADFAERAVKWFKRPLNWLSTIEFFHALCPISLTNLQC